MVDDGGFYTAADESNEELRESMRRSIRSRGVWFVTLRGPSLTPAFSPLLILFFPNSPFPLLLQIWTLPNLMMEIGDGPSGLDSVLEPSSALAGAVLWAEAQYIWALHPAHNRASLVQVIIRRNFKTN